MAELAIPSSAFPPGYEYNYKEVTAATTTTTQTTRASAPTVLTADSITFDGSTTICIEFSCLSVGHSVDGGRTSFVLWEDGTDRAVIGICKSQLGSSVGPGVFYKARYMPAAGAKVLTLRFYVIDAGTATLNAGAGTAASNGPMYMRIVKA